MGVEHREHVTFGVSMHIRNRGNLRLGERCAIGSFARIWNYAPITIGDDFLAAGGLTLNSATHDALTLVPEGRPITIGNRVWCGVNVTILAGVMIGDDVVIGAGAVVVQDIPSNSVAAGVPAKRIKPLNRTADTRLWRWVEAESKDK
jgi:maltose O-acetyltransferase